MKALALLGALGLAAALLANTAHADDNFGGATVIFARDDALYRTDPKGKKETLLVKLPAKTRVRALRTDATGSVLLADLAGKWSWMRLDGKATSLTDFPCADGPAQLAVDGDCVVCRSVSSTTGAVIVNLNNNKVSAVPVPAPGARLTGTGKDRRLVWADADGVWSAPARDAKKKQQVAPESPLRSFLPSPDGARAVGVYLDKVYDSVKTTKPAELLMGFALDGQAARRKAIKNGVPLEWSHDGQWVLVQDRVSSCIMSATGGEYKCWRGFTSASIAPDGQWSLVLGSSNRSAPPPKKPAKKPVKGAKAGKPGKDGKDGKEAEPSNEAENAGEDATPDDVEVAPPTGPLALYRTTLAGPYSLSPALIVKNVDGAAVWVPGPAAPEI